MTDLGTTPTGYELRVRGHLDDHWSTWFDLTVTRNDDGTSTLVGPIPDQSRLHGVLAHLRDLGVPLLALHPAADTTPGRGTDERRPPPPVLTRPVRTARLTLRPATPVDAPATFGYRRLESVGRWLTEVPTDLETYRATFTEPSRLSTTVVVDLDGETIGDLMLRLDDGWAQTEVAGRARRTQAELGWALDPAHDGRGYATEAVRGLIRVCFEDLAVRRVVAHCFAENDGSRRLMERVGMRLEGYAVADSLHRSGRWLDTVTYALLADERGGLRRPGLVDGPGQA